MKKSHCTSRAVFLFCFCCDTTLVHASFGDLTNAKVWFWGLIFFKQQISCSCKSLSLLNIFLHSAELYGFSLFEYLVTIMTLEPYFQFLFQKGLFFPPLLFWSCAFISCRNFIKAWPKKATSFEGSCLS